MSTDPKLKREIRRYACSLVGSANIPAGGCADIIFSAWIVVGAGAQVSKFGQLEAFSKRLSD
jgi:hypothetical protein